MYEKCLECRKLGVTCDGPNFMAMSAADLADWCNTRRRQMPGMTYDRISELTGLSKGTVAGFFGAKHTDNRLETLRPILKLLVGGEWDDNPCGDPTSSERAKFEEQIRQLEEGVTWRDDKIKHFTEENDRLRVHNAKKDEEHEKNTAFIQKQLELSQKTIKSLRLALTIVSIVLGVAVAVIIAALVVDRLNSGVGFFWLESIFRPNGVTDVINSWRT